MARSEERQIGRRLAASTSHAYCIRVWRVLLQSIMSVFIRSCCHAGDLSKPNLGLKPDVYKDLAQSLDTVIHNGALVNHAFTYEQLFEPNVLGSLQVRQSCTHSHKVAERLVNEARIPVCSFMPSPLLNELLLQPD